jgi:hypothetical protein
LDKVCLYEWNYACDGIVQQYCLTILFKSHCNGILTQE